MAWHLPSRDRYIPPLQFEEPTEGVYWTTEKAPPVLSGPHIRERVDADRQRVRHGMNQGARTGAVGGVLDGTRLERFLTPVTPSIVMVSNRLQARTRR
jgi:hypothetical protein